MDADGDGYSTGTGADDDCDDANADIHPGSDELCDGVDNDCDGVIDDADELAFLTWYPDTDGDGFGDDEAAGVTSCEDPTTSSGSYVSNALDCDDADANVHPGAEEVPCDGTDNDCDGEVDGSIEVFDDGIDNDCDGLIDEGLDPGGAMHSFDAGSSTFCDIRYDADWTRQIDSCPDCDWAFEVELTYNPDTSSGTDACEFTEDLVWDCAFFAGSGLEPGTMAFSAPGADTWRGASYLGGSWDYAYSGVIASYADHTNYWVSFEVYAPSYYEDSTDQWFGYFRVAIYH